MKTATFSIACIAALLPLAVSAADQTTSTNDSSQDQSSVMARRNFDKLDNDRDGRLSKMEAASDAKVSFASVDTNGDGYIDRMEYTRHSAKTGVPSSQSPESSSPNSPGTSSKTDPNQPAGTQPAGNRPHEDKPQ
jgi:hypothetical protein